jgi:hypothetical protein
VQAKFQDGRRRHFGDLSACYKMGNYHPILMQIGTLTKKNMLSSKFTLPQNFKMAAAAMLEIQVTAGKWAIATRF